MPSTKGKSAQKGVRTLGVDKAELESLFGLMQRYDIREMQWGHGDGALEIRRGEAGGSSQGTWVQAPVAAPASREQAAPAASKPASRVSANQKEIKSPFVGTFYRAASPSTPMYVKEGQQVKKGDTLCIIEAMKLMNEIESEFDGRIAKVLVENGQPVEFGEPLFVIEA